MDPETNSSNNPLVSVEFRISRPCGRLSNSYVNRTGDLKRYYRVDQCNFDDDGNKEHILYYPTTFRQSEYTVSKENDLIDTIKANVPSFSEGALKWNSYYLYYRPYSHWSSKC